MDSQGGPVDVIGRLSSPTRVRRATAYPSEIRERMVALCEVR